MQIQKNILIHRQSNISSNINRDLDFLDFLYFIDIVNKNYQSLSEFRIKGWILNELLDYCKKPTMFRNAEDHIDSIKDKYYQLFEIPTFENANEAEQQVISELFAQYRYADKFFISLEYYLDNPDFFKTQFMTVEVIRAMKEYEGKVIKF